MAPVDVLAIGAHPDDCELVCGGTLLRCADQGYRTAVLDLTGGELGTRGSGELRGRERMAAAEVLGLATRRSAGLPDTGIANTDATRKAVVAVIRELRPSLVIVPYGHGRHPDHRLTTELARDACFLAGVGKFGEGSAHRPRKVIYGLAYREEPIKPTFVVDVTEQHARKLDALRCYGSQFDEVLSAGEPFPNGQPFYDLIATQDRAAGTRIRRGFGEPYFTPETVRIDDVVAMGVRSM